MLKYLHIIPSTILTMIGWSALMIAVMQVVGEGAIKDYIWLAPLGALASFYIFTILCTVTAIIVFNIPRLRHKLLILYIAPMIISTAASFLFRWY